MNKACLIDRVRMVWGRMPVSVSFSYGKVDYFHFLFIRLSAGSAEGVGEAMVPTNQFIKEFLPSLLNADAGALDSLLPVTNNDHDRILCEGVSMALYDLSGHIFSLPIRTLLGGSKEKVVPLMPCIFPNSPEEAGKKAAHFFSGGYRYLKTKLVGNLSEDLARVKAIRKSAPEGITLQGDANCGYKTIPEAGRAVAELGAAGLDIFEDPLDGGVSEYCQLRDWKGAKIMVDTLARRTEDLREVLRKGAADVVGIHPDQPGSLSRALGHVSLCRGFGVPVVIGGTGYAGVGSAAYQQLTAVATPGGPCGELGGFFDHGMPVALVKQTLPMENGAIILSDRPGIGVELDEEKLKERQEGEAEWRR